MKAKLLVLIVALLGMIVPGVPMITATTPVHAATNNLVIGYYNGMTTVAAKYNVSVYLNNPVVVNQDGKPISGTADFVINFSQITIQAGEVTMYLSTNGYAQISSSDVQLYSLPTSLINSSKLSKITVTASNGQKLTLTVGEKAIIGAIPLVAVPQGLYYVKAYFGSTAPVATSIAEVNVLPTISISPTSGPAGQTVTVKGYAFSSSHIVNLIISYYVRGKLYKYSHNINASSTGTFTYTFTAPELKLETPAPMGYSTGTVSFQANDTETKTLSNTATWTELPREFTAIAYYSPVIAGWATIRGLFFNGSFSYVPFYETEPIKVTGNYFDPNSQVKLYFDGSLIATATTNGTGYFTVSANVPIAAAGTYTVNATDPLAYIYFSGTTVPEVVVTPNQVVPGQSITVNGYAYTKNSMVNATLLGLELGMHNVTILTNGMNVPTNSLGEWSFSSKIPMAIYGGVHYINATDLNGLSAYAEITVNPLMVLSTSKAPLGSNVTVNLYGLSVGYEYWPLLGLSTGGPYYYYGIAYDNILTYAAPTFGNMTGENSTLITAAGYPMLHAVQLVIDMYPYYYPFTLVSTAWLNVTGTTNTEAQTTAAIKSLNTSVSSQLSSLSSSISSDYSSLSSMLSSLNASVTGISNSVSSLSGNLTTQYSSIMSSLVSISTLVSGLKTTISSDYSSLSSAISSLSSTVSTISSSSSSISSSVTSIGTSVSSLQSAVSSLQSTVSSLSTYLLVVAVLAIIIIVLELVLLVRKK